MEKTVAVIQARMGSTRLPGKVLRDLCGKPVLAHVIQRVRQMQTVDDIVIATTTRDQDDVLADLCGDLSVNCFRGSEADVLARYYHAARENHADHVVRITSDCPLYDPVVGDLVIDFYHDHGYDIVSNAGALDSKRTYPPGLDTEVFSFRALEEAFQLATETYQREHVTPYIYEQQANRVYHFNYPEDFSHFRWTLDTPEDYRLIQEVYDKLYRGEHDFYMMDIVALMKQAPHLPQLNASVRQKKYNAVEPVSERPISAHLGVGLKF